MDEDPYMEIFTHNLVPYVVHNEKKPPDYMYQDVEGKTYVALEPGLFL